MYGKKRRKPESVLSERVANLLISKYPKIPFHFDYGADVPMSRAHRLRRSRMHGKWSRGFPDLMVLSSRGGYGGLFLELKATETVPNTDHTRRQAIYHSVLRKQGYNVVFVCGYDDCKKKLKKYMKLKKNKTND